jgi:hypothetical protein
MCNAPWVRDTGFGRFMVEHWIAASRRLVPARVDDEFLVVSVRDKVGFYNAVAGFEPIEVMRIIDAGPVPGAGSRYIDIKGTQLMAGLGLGGRVRVEYFAEDTVIMSTRGRDRRYRLRFREVDDDTNDGPTPRRAKINRN